MKNFHASTHSHYSRVLTRFFLAALFFSVILFSCKDEKIEPPVSSLSAEEKNTIPNLRKGIQILSFENLKQFQDTFYELSGSDLKRKEFLQNSKSSEFKSLKGYYDSIELSEIEDLMKNKEKLQASKSLISIINNGDSTISYRVENAALQLLLNHNRQVEIGDEILTFDYNEIFIINKKSGKSETRKIQRDKNGNSKKGKVKGYTYWADYYEYGGDKYKYEAGILHVDYGSYFNTADFEIEHWKKSWGFYWHSNTYYMRAYGTYNGGPCNSSPLPYSFSYDHQDWSVSKISENFIASQKPCIDNLTFHGELVLTTSRKLYFDYDFE